MVKASDLVELRKRLGVNQLGMAQLIDSTQQTVSRMEKGEIELTESAQKLILRYAPHQKLVKKGLILKPLRNGELQTNELRCTENEHNLNFKKDATSADWERWWWHKKNKLCERCIMKCKQSSQVKIIDCPQFERVHE